MEDDVRVFKRRKIQDLEQKRAHKRDSPAAKEAWEKAVKDIKDIDTAIRNGAKTLAEVKTAIIQNASLVAEINTELGISEEVVVAKEAVVEPKQTFDGGVFSARLEALICAALQDGVLTEQEKAILKKRVEKEGEDWDEVEMIINSRLAEMKSVSKENQKAEMQISPKTKQNKKVAIEKPVVVQQPLPDVKYEIIPEGLEVIRNEYKSFEGIKFPSSVKRIENWALGKCDKLKALDFSQCSQLEEISHSAFSNSSNIESIILPPALKKIGGFAFEKCSSLKTLDFSQCQLEEIGEASFSECVFESMILPPTLKKIGPYAFQDCRSLKVLDFSQCTQLEEISNRAFLKCSSLKALDFSQCTQLEEIGPNLFNLCGVRTIVMPPSLIKIKAPLGNSMEQLKKIDFSNVNNLQTIPGHFVDSGCRKLTELTIPMGVTEIEDDAFNDMLYDLRNLFLPPTLESIGDIEYKMERLSIYCFSHSLEELGPIVYKYEEWSTRNCRFLFVLPQYLDKYISQRKAERIPQDVLIIREIPEEYRYYYDN